MATGNAKGCNGVSVALATAPNAIAYSSGLLTLKRMLTVGLGLNIAAAVLIIAFAAAA